MLRVLPPSPGGVFTIAYKYKWVIERAVFPRKCEGVHNGLGPSERLVMQALLSLSDSEAVIPDDKQPSLAEIAWASGLGDTAVKSALRKLEDKKWIVRDRSRGRDRSRYELRTPELDRATSREATSSDDRDQSRGDQSTSREATSSELPTGREATSAPYIRKHKYENKNETGGQDLPSSNSRAAEDSNDPLEVFDRESKPQAQSNSTPGMTIVKREFLTKLAVFRSEVPLPASRLAKLLNKWMHDPDQPISEAEIVATLDVFVRERSKYQTLADKFEPWRAYTFRINELLTTVRKRGDLQDERTMLAAMPQADKIKYLENKFGSWD